MLCLRTDHTVPPFAYCEQTHNSKCGGPENSIAHFFKARSQNPCGEKSYSLGTAAHLRVVIRETGRDMQLILIKVHFRRGIQLITSPISKFDLVS